MTTTKKINRRAVIKFLTKQGKTLRVIDEETMAVSHDSVPLLSSFQEKFSKLKRVRHIIKENQVASATTEENVKIIEKFELEDTRVRIKTLT